MESKREKVFLLVLLLGSILLAAIAGTTVYFINKKTTELRTANSALSTRISTAKNKIAQLPLIRQERELAQAELQVAESILPSQKEIEMLVDSLSEFARQSGVIIAKAEPVRQVAYQSARGGAKRFEEAQFDLDIEGDYFQFVEFVNNLENYKRFIRVDDFTISAGKVEGEPHSVKLKFATFTYNDTTAPVKGAVR